MQSFACDSSECLSEASMSQSICNDTSNIAARLNQRLAAIDTASSQLSLTRDDLRQNADIARQNIATAISHQIACVRAREQELLSQLAELVNAKETSLNHQQEKLSQATGINFAFYYLTDVFLFIGMFQQSLDLLARDVDGATNADELLRRCVALDCNLIYKICAFSFNSLTLRQRENSIVIFESEPYEFRRSIALFGSIITDDAPVSLRVLKTQAATHQNFSRRLSIPILSHTKNMDSQPSRLLSYFGVGLEMQIVIPIKYKRHLQQQWRLKMCSSLCHRWATI